MPITKFARRGVCPLCRAEVWQDPEDFFRPVLNAEPLEPGDVIQRLKARSAIYQQVGVIGKMFVYANPLTLARLLKTGGALPPDLHGMHDHQEFKPLPKPKIILPERPPF